jgi:hypothetical protein
VNYLPLQHKLQAMHELSIAMSFVDIVEEQEGIPEGT